jgi:glycolate oxidase FAD binding subunit
VIEYDPRDLTIAVEAGMTLRALAATLARNGQFVPLDAPHPDRATVGGTLAAGWLAPRRLAYGRPRDLVIGTTAALADGTLSHAGGMVVKNVTGYDMSKLFVGSLGTLGALVRINLKALPAPATIRVAVAALPEGTREKALEHLGALPIEPTCALAIRRFGNEIDGSDGLDGRIFAMFEGSATVVDRATRELRSALGAAGVPATTILDANAPRAYQRVLDAAVTNLGKRSLTLRSTGLPETVLMRAASLDALAAEHNLTADSIADVRTGDAIVRFSAADIATMLYLVGTLVENARDRLSAITVVAGEQKLRAAVDAWGEPPSSIEKMRALKERFDPRAILGRGRFVGGI